MARRLVLSVLTLGLIAGLAPQAATTAGPQPSAGAARAKLADAIGDEQLALRLLKKKPPRVGRATLVLERAGRTLAEIQQETRGSDFDQEALSQRLDEALGTDVRVATTLGRHRAGDSLEWAELSLTDALDDKQIAMTLLSQPATATGPQCADRRDNDGDGVIDTRHDSGCSSKTDSTENSRLSCTAESTQDGAVSVVTGACTGPFAELTLTTPAGSAFDAAPRPQVTPARSCLRSHGGRRYRCRMRDGRANRRHRFTARLPFADAGRVKVQVTDFAGHTQTVAPPAPFTLGPDPVTAFGTFTGGQGGCPVATTFTDTFAFLAPGDGTLTISQPTTGDRVSGPIDPKGAFQLENAGESYAGLITGNTATAQYAYTANGCTETYDARFELQRR